MRFQDEQVHRRGLFSIGHDTVDDVRYLSIPVANRMVTYDEYFRLDQTSYDRFRADYEAAYRFAEECRRRLHDDLLILSPGTDRGSAV